MTIIPLVSRSLTGRGLAGLIRSAMFLAAWYVGNTGLLCHSSAAARADEPKHAADTEEDWQVIFIQGQRVGYLHSRIWESKVDGHTRVWTEATTRMTIKRFGASLSMTISQLTEEDLEGNLLSFVYKTDNPPMSSSRITGRVKGDTLHLETTTAGKITKSTKRWDGDVKSPAYQERLLEKEVLEPGEALSLKTFDPQFLKVATITLTGKEPAPTELLSGRQRTLDRVQMTHSLVPGLTTTIFSDEEGDVLKTEANLLQMVTYSVSREDALKEIEGEELDLAVNTLVKVNPIKDAHATRRIEYELTLNSPQAVSPVPEGPTQTVTRIDDRTYRIVVSVVSPDAGTRSNSEDEVPEKYLTPSRHLQCADPSVVRMAEAAAGDQTDPARIAVAMERHVYQKLTSKNFSTALATAAEVAQSLEGDCTEHAVLLAAMLRVKEIPSRLVVGLVYAGSHSAFGGHMWTEAYLNGRWVPLDATLGRGGIGAGHIKFADSSFDDDGPAPVTSFLPLIRLLEQIQLRVVSVES